MTECTTVKECRLSIPVSCGDALPYFDRAMEIKNEAHKQAHERTYTDTHARIETLERELGEAQRETTRVALEQPAYEASVKLLHQCDSLRAEVERLETFERGAMAFEAQFDAFRAENERLSRERGQDAAREHQVQAENAHLREALAGFFYMINKSALVRNTAGDSNTDYPARSMRFAQWLSRAQAALHPDSTREA